jgi:hypothetical protein
MVNQSLWCSTMASFAIRAVRESMLFLAGVDINARVRVHRHCEFSRSLFRVCRSGSVIANNLGHETGNHDDREDRK